MTGFTCRLLVADEWKEFRDMRLEAVRAHPGYFGGGYDEEKDLSEERWRVWVHSKNSRGFGLFDGGKMIGITGLVTSRDDPGGKTVLFVATYIRPEYRGRGLSDLLYRARLNYAAAHPVWQRAVISHRDGNEPSRRANRRHGFAYTHTENREWPDGTRADNLFYALDLKKSAPAQKHEP